MPLSVLPVPSLCYMYSVANPEVRVPTQATSAKTLKNNNSIGRAPVAIMFFLVASPGGYLGRGVCSRGREPLGWERCAGAQRISRHQIYRSAQRVHDISSVYSTPSSPASELQ